MRTMLPLLLLLVPAAAADNTLYFTADSLDVSAPAGEGELVPLNMRGLVAPSENGYLEWTYTMKAAGDVLPVATTLYIQNDEQIVMPPSYFASAAGVNGCLWYLVATIDDAGWFFCNNQYQASVLEPGIHPVEFDWNGDLDAAPASPGSELHVSLSTGAFSPEQAPKLKVLLGSTENPAAFEFAGTNEPVPIVVDQGSGSTTTTTTTSTTRGAPTSSGGTSSPAPTSANTGTSERGATTTHDDSHAAGDHDADEKSSPGIGTLAILALAGVALLRRRLQ